MNEESTRWTMDVTFLELLLILITLAPDESRRSTMGSIVILNSGPISWSSTLGKTVALSTCEAEVNAACSAARDAVHIISQAEAGIRHVRNAKHYEVKHRFYRTLLSERRFSLSIVRMIYYLPIL